MTEEIQEPKKRGPKPKTITYVPPVQQSIGFNVTRACFHQAVDVKGLGVESSLYSDKGTKSVKMRWQPDGLYCEYKEKKFIVPHANVIVVYV